MRAKPIIRLSDGKRFVSAIEASEALYFNEEYIRQMARAGKGFMYGEHDPKDLAIQAAIMHERELKRYRRYYQLHKGDKYVTRREV